MNANSKLETKQSVNPSRIRKLAVEKFEDRKLFAAILFSESVGRTIINDNGGFYSGTDTYQLALDSSPSPNTQVKISIASNTAVVGTALLFNIPSSEVIFTDQNWSIPQQVTVYGKGDGNAATGNSIATLTHTVVTTDPAFANATVPKLTVQVIDTDSQPYRLTYEGSVKEGDGSRLYFGDAFYSPADGVYYPIAYVGPEFSYLPDNQLNIVDGGRSFGLQVEAVNDGVLEGLHYGRVKFSPNTANPNNYSIPDFLVEITDGIPENLRITHVSINNGETQRSMLTSVDIVTSAAATIDASKFKLINTTTGLEIPIDVSAFGSISTIRITFPNGNGVVSRTGGNSLSDGRYRLSIQAGGIQSVSTPQSVAAFSFGDNASDGFFRLFGDMNGNGQIDVSDVRAMSNALLSRIGNARYVAALDYFGNGIVGADDLVRFARNLTRRL